MDTCPECGRPLTKPVVGKGHCADQWHKTGPFPPEPPAVTPFEYLYVRKNDGSPSPYSAEQRALAEAFVAFHEAGGYEWRTVEIANLPCTMRAEHYPDICWHYRVTITPKVVAPEPTDEQKTRVGNYFDSADARTENDWSL